MSKHSLVIKTMNLLKINLKLDRLEDLKDTGVKILEIVNDILRESGLLEVFHDSGIVI